MLLSDIYKRYPTQELCLLKLEEARWGGVPRCPYCGSTNQSPIYSEDRYHCNECKTAYSAMVRTIFHKSRVDLQKWFYALWAVDAGGANLSVRQLARILSVNKDTAQAMINKIKVAASEINAKEYQLIDNLLNSLRQ